MDVFCDERDDQFFDAREDLSSVSDWSSDCSDDCSSSVLGRLGYDFWTHNPDSVHERRRKFLKWMGFDLDQDLIKEEDSEAFGFPKIELDIERVKETSGAVLRNSPLEKGWFSSSQSSTSSLSNEAPESLANAGLVENFVCKSRNSDDGSELSPDELGHGEIHGRLPPVRSNRSVSTKEFQSSYGDSLFVQQLSHREVEGDRYFADTKRKVKRGWLRKLGIGMCVANGDSVLSPIVKSTPMMGTRTVQVHPHKKKNKELSSLYAGQVLQAHEGAILTMRFSLDGHYLATAGEDGIVRVWMVLEDERLNKFDKVVGDPSCRYFRMDHLNRVDPLDLDKEKLGNVKKVQRSSDSACVIFPPKIFSLLDKPLHEFRGHCGEVLDLSWSSKGFLLSSSVDKTVRLWQVGYDRCLRVFSHNNYVTCVDFNPLDDNYFISGSIDGKVRIWEVLRCRVVDYIDIREIVTAVSYHPDGKGGIVGTMTGNCIYYEILDNRLQLNDQICLQGKKKSPGKRITGFQFTPSDPSKVMVTSADSVVRILCGNHVVCKFKGLRNSATPMSASFTSDGKHIVSATDDSNVHIWNYSSQEKTSSRTKKICSSESFISNNASIALPWCGAKALPDTIPSPAFVRRLQGSEVENGLNSGNLEEDLETKMPLSSPDCFSLSRSLLDSLSRGSATWPEEKLMNAIPVAASPTLCKSELKFLRSAGALNMSGSPHMWDLVIVTAGWDGRIRTYHNYGMPIRV
ncbi:hypothetical protein UlMin_001720 [Ulmus minor]